MGREWWRWLGFLGVTLGVPLVLAAWLRARRRYSDMGEHPEEETMERIDVVLAVVTDLAELVETIEEDEQVLGSVQLTLLRMFLAFERRACELLGI